MLKWTKQLQKLGRIQIPTDYLNSYQLKEGDKVVIEQTKEDLTLLIKFVKKRKK